MPYVGEPYSWKPCAYEGIYGAQDLRSARGTDKLNGRVVYVNREHRYFTAEAQIFGYKLRESFKF